jgi:isorenieratene synthase
MEISRAMPPDNLINKIDHQTIQVLIIGGGMAGLSAGLHLAERGILPTIIEADPNFIGGRAAGGDSIDINGWKFRSEHGIHGIWSPYRNLQAMLARNRIRPVFVSADEETWIYKNRQRVRRSAVGSVIRHSWFPAPFHYLALFFSPRFLSMLNISDWLSLPFVWYGLLFGLGIDPLREEQPMESLWLSDITKHWAAAVRAFITGLARNGLAAKPTEVQLAGFIAFLRFYTLLRRDTWAFSYMPADGGTSMAEPIAKKIREFGGDIRLGIQAVNLAQDNDQWHVNCDPLEAGQSSLIFQADQVVLAVDSSSAEKLLSANPKMAAVANSLYWPRGMETAVIRIWFDCMPKPGAEAGIFTGDFILHNFFWVSRLQDQYVRWSKATGGSTIEVHIYGPPEILVQPDSVLIAQAIKDIQDAFPELRGHRMHQTMQRNKSTHTLFSIGPAKQHLGTITPWPNLFCCGDWIRHSSPAFFLERACVTGIEAANNILISRNLEPWKLLEYPKPEPIAGFIEKIFRKGRRLKRQRHKSLEPKI